MLQEELIKKIKAALENMSCAEVSFPEPKDNFVIATFNCQALTSFKAELPGWKHSGISLDPSGKKQFKIEFIKEQ
ncbi:MAG TPA: hypothetical protein VJG90_00910 [Candidatus Nanoarchaeia archaeon]|nr:hypothetical protein [Candidatus Nanoarchaeia archaeon]